MTGDLNSLLNTPCSLDIPLSWAIKVWIFWRVEITKPPKNKEITFHRGDFMYHRFHQTAWLAPKTNIKQAGSTFNTKQTTNLNIKTERCNKLECFSFALTHKGTNLHL